jgi:outer membrane protein insertion porin family
MIQSDVNALSALISEKGYPHVSVKDNVVFSEDSTKAFITYSIDKGPFVKVGQVYYRGNFKTKKYVLDREFELKRGAPFSLSKMLEGQRGLRDLNLFDTVKLKAIGLQEKREEVDLVVEVEQKRPYFFEMGGGYDSQRGVYGHSKLGDHNLFGTNKDIWLGAEASEIGYRIESRIEEPRLLGSRISADAGVFIEQREEFNKDFGTDVYGLSLGFTRSWWKHLVTGLHFRFERRDQFNEGGAALNEEVALFEPRSLFVTTPSVRLDTRDSFTRPKQGGVVQFAVDISKGLTNDLDSFFKYKVDCRYYVTPFSRLTFAWKARFGYLDSYGSSDAVPDDQLFFLGGTSDVRGFDENLLSFDGRGDPLGGRWQSEGSAEARIDLGGNFELPIFFDIGRISETSVDHETADKFRSAVGFGLRYITPIGPIGILYGRKLDPVAGESSGQFHFAIGYTF